MKILTLLLLFISITALASLDEPPTIRKIFAGNAHWSSNNNRIGRTQRTAKGAQPRKIYVAKRADNLQGSGTEIDSLNAGNDLHAIWSQVLAANPRVVEFAKATYVTTDVLAPISNCDIRGNGATIQAAASFGVTNRHKWIFQIGGDGFNGVNYCHIHGFTFDCNMDGQIAANPVIGAIGIQGGRNLISHNRFIHFGGRSDRDIECFVAAIAANTAQPAYDNEIAHNEFTSDATSTGSVTIVMITSDQTTVDDFASPTTKWEHGGRIHHNWFHDLERVQCIGSGAWSVGQQIYDNTFRHIDGVCIYTDTGASHNLTIRNNRMEDVKQGILLRSTLGPSFFQENLTIAGNEIAVKSDLGGATGFNTTGITLGTGSAPHAVVFRNLTVRANRIRRYASTGTPLVGICITDVDGGIIKNNWVAREVGESDRNVIGIFYSKNVLARNNTSRAVVDGDGNSGVRLLDNFNVTGTGRDRSGQPGATPH